MVSVVRRTRAALVACALLAAPLPARALGAEEWNLRALGLTLRGALPEGWVATEDEAYPTIAGRLLAPGGEATITLTVFPAWPAVPRRILAERDAAALRRFGFVATVTGTTAGAPELRARHPASGTSVVARYLTRRGRTIAVLLACPTQALARRTGALEAVIATIRADAP